MKKYETWEQIKKDYPYTKEDPNKAIDVFEDYVMNVITLEQRREIRKDWNNLAVSVLWQDYLLQQTNKINISLKEN